MSRILLVVTGSLLLLANIGCFHYLQSNVVVDMYRRSNAANTNKYVCPKVRPLRNFDLQSILGPWYVIQYYASSEEANEYGCMRCDFRMLGQNVVMNFTYTFEDDPLKEHLLGNITWNVPDFGLPSHWTHAEDPYEGIYNTYVLDTDGSEWALIMHCAEKNKIPRYLSAMLLSRNRRMGANVLSFLRDKLPRYDIDVALLFDIDQDQCGDANGDANADVEVEAVPMVVVD